MNRRPPQDATSGCSNVAICRCLFAKTDPKRVRHRRNTTRVRRRGMSRLIAMSMKWRGRSRGDRTSFADGFAAKGGSKIWLSYGTARIDHDLRSPSPRSPEAAQSAATHPVRRMTPFFFAQFIEEWMSRAVTQPWSTMSQPGGWCPRQCRTIFGGSSEKEVVKRSWIMTRRRSPDSGRTSVEPSRPPSPQKPSADSSDLPWRNARGGFDLVDRRLIRLVSTTSLDAFAVVVDVPERGGQILVRLARTRAPSRVTQT